MKETNHIFAIVDNKHGGALRLAAVSLQRNRLAGVGIFAVRLGEAALHAA